MLPIDNRLIKKSDFEKVSKFGSFFSFGQILLKVTKNDLQKTKIGVSIGLKFSKKAVERNRIKRQIREIIRKKLKNIKRGMDIVVMAKGKKINKLTSREIEEMIIGALRKGNLID